MTCPHCGRQSASPSSNLCATALKGQSCSSPGVQLNKAQHLARVKSYLINMTNPRDCDFMVTMIEEYGKACAREAQPSGVDVPNLVSATADIIEEFRKYPNRPSRAMMAAITRAAVLLGKQ